jgi:hypothetical protein
MRAAMQGAGFLLLLTAALGIAAPSSAQTVQLPSSTSEEPGSVIVFPKFLKGAVKIDGVRKAQTEIDVRARCPKDIICSEGEPVKIRFHWVCPGSQDTTPKFVCQDSGFDVKLSVDAKVSLNPEDPKLLETNAGTVAPCPSGYLIGWVISPASGRPIKYDALTGNATLRDANGVSGSYEAITIRADPNLASRAEITTDIDPRSGTPALVFDGGAGHYQAVAGTLPTNLEYHKLFGPPPSSAAFLILLTLDVRVNRPNYPIFIDLDFRGEGGVRTSTSWNFRCWTEIQNPGTGTNFVLAGARTRNGVLISGAAIKVPYGGISDIPGPVTLLGLVPTDEGAGGRTMDPAYVLKRFEIGKPTTVFVPSD